jgi:hypothetical protein
MLLLILMMMFNAGFHGHELVDKIERKNLEKGKKSRVFLV